MNLSALAIRLAAMQALMDATLAEGRVFDSRIDDLEALVAEERKPMLVISTDESDGNVIGRDVFAPTGTLDLTIEIGLASRTTVTVKYDDGSEEEREELVVPDTDAGLEALINIIGYQVMRVLFADAGEWQEILKVFAPRVVSISSRRGGGIDKGGRYAVRQIVIKIDPLADPQPGQVPHASDAWGRLIPMLKAKPEVAKYGKIVEDVISAGSLPGWQAVRGQLGLTDFETSGIGVAPVVLSPPHPATEFIIGDGSDGDMIVDESTADDALGEEAP